ncbi:MAG: Lin0512 family protein [Candidatus Lokiarchaeota archaeon]|nr:Lin0512 family protein [Candidatus Lokiarchaeota archaeon]
MPFGSKSIEIEKGGLVIAVIMVKKLGDTTDKIIVCNTAVNISIL